MSLERELVGKITVLQESLERLRASVQQPGLWLQFLSRTSVMQFSVSGVTVFTAGIFKTIIYPQKFECKAFVVTTNNATNYWTITAGTAVAAGIASVNTSAVAANGWRTLIDLTFAAPSYTGATDAVIDISITKTGTPGDLFLAPGLLVF